MSHVQRQIVKLDVFLPIRRPQSYIMADVTFVTSRAFHLEEIPYSISVYRSSEGFTAFCDCHKCADHSMRSAPKADRDSAITECENQIRQHHADFHNIALCG